VTPLSWSLPAQRDIARIAAQLDEIDPVLAARTVFQIRSSSWRLREFPLSAPRIGRSSFRKLVVAGAPYLLVHQLVDQKIFVVRVRHAHEDWSPR
jgi:plasmid stabilization system protein ParE